MTTRGKATFQKRQKELARKDRQKRKAERREERKQARAAADRVPPQDAAVPAADESSERMRSRHDGLEA
jgi:hypothetical protein